MGEFAYTKVPGKINDLLSKIKQTGVPERATVKWLSSVGLASSNDRSLLGVLKFINFTDDEGKPTDQWKQYRGSDSKKILASCIKQGYSELYKTYPEAHLQSNPDLESFFRTKTSAGQQVVTLTVNTFKSLCQLADFRMNGSQEPLAIKPPILKEAEYINSKITFPDIGKEVTINLNIQLSLPETTDITVYDNFFAALKKHLMPSGDGNE